jgi:hypothetical protein
LRCPLNRLETVTSPYDSARYEISTTTRTSTRPEAMSSRPAAYTLTRESASSRSASVCFSDWSPFTSALSPTVRL